MSKQPRIGVIGAGRFGRAFIQGILNSKFVPLSHVWASARSEATLSKVRDLGVTATADFSTQIAATNILLLSVKPAQMVEVLEKLNASELSEETLLISVAAGTAVSKIEAHLKCKSPVIRSMPNSPSSIGLGITAFCRGRLVKEAHLESARALFDTIGSSIEVHEDHMNLVTAVSGSGPAYFYFVMEAMIEASVQAGLSRAQAERLVIHTARGASEMALKAGRTLLDLKGDVATPGGCTMEALKVFEAECVAEIFSKAIRAATVKSASLQK